MLPRQVSSSSLKIAAGTIKSVGSAPSSPGLPRALSSSSLHQQGSALASPQSSPRFLDFYPTLPHSPPVTKSRLVPLPQRDCSSATVVARPTLPDPSRTAKGRAVGFPNDFVRPVRFELPPVVIEGLPVQQGLPGFASFNFGSVHSVTYRSTCERLPTPYPLREDLDWLELQDEAEFLSLNIQENPDSESDSSTPGASTESSPSLLMPGFPSVLCYSKENAAPAVPMSLTARSRQRLLPHSKSLSDLESLAKDFITATNASLSSSRPSARPMLLSALSSALARRERSRRIRFEALPFAVHLDGDPSWKSSQQYIPTPFPSPRAGRALDPDLMFDSVS